MVGPLVGLGTLSGGPWREIYRQMFLNLLLPFNFFFLVLETEKQTEKNRCKSNQIDMFCHN